MAFLAPLVWLGLATLAVPVIIHMIQRERSEVIEFPSLMFLRRIPYHSFRRQRIRHWLLLLLRCAAIALLLAAFARPFLRDQAMASAAVGPREVVVLLDRSLQHGLRRSLESGAGRCGRRHRGARAGGPHQRDPVRQWSRGGAAVDDRPGQRGGPSGLGGAGFRHDTVRSGPDARRGHPGRFRPAAPRGRIHQRLPAGRGG